MGITSDDEVLEKFKYVYENQRKIADDNNTNWDKKHYKFDTLTRHDNFFDYLGNDPHDMKAVDHRTPVEIEQAIADEKKKRKRNAGQ